jgi:integrase
VPATGNPTGKLVRGRFLQAPQKEVQDTMTKRRYGTGAIKLRSDGRWEGQLRLAGGARKYVYARNRSDVVVRLHEERWRLANGIPMPSRGLLLGPFLCEWLAVTRSRVRPRTYDAYELSLHRIDRILGTVPLVRLNAHLIQRAYSDLLASGLSPKTVLNTHAVLHRALKQALHWGLTNALATELVAVPRPRQREMQALSAAQLTALLASTRTSHWYPLWVLLGTAGLRIGEALGLKWCDIDLNAGRLQVRRALQRQRGLGLVFVEPKSYRSRRMVCLCRLAVEALSELRQHSDGELVFLNRQGLPQDSSSVTGALKVALDRAGLPQIRVHDLRHTTATVLLEAGAHPKLVQDLLGHSTVALTLNTYSHVTAGLSDQAAKTMDRVLGDQQLCAC